MTRLEAFCERLVDAVADIYDHGDSMSTGRARAVAERMVREFVIESDTTAGYSLDDFLDEPEPTEKP